MKFTLISQNFLGNPKGIQGVKENGLIGGAEINLFRVAQLLLRNGHEVTLVQEDNNVGIDNYQGIDMKYVKVPDYENSLIRELCFNIKWRKYVPAGSIVHLQHEGYAFPFYKGIHSVNQQGIGWDSPGRRKFSTVLKLWTLKRLLKQGTYVRASDNSFLTYVQSEWTNFRNQIHPIPNGVDTNKFCPQSINPEDPDHHVKGRLIILFPRTLTIYRGAYLFLESLKILKEKINDDFLALFVGGIKREVKEEVQSRIDKYGLQKCTDFIGHVPNEKMPQYYNIADIVTIPTYHSEGSSISCLEAMSCGKPVVVTDVGGLKELIYRDEIDGGLKVKPTPEALANGLVKLVKNPKLRKKLGKNARVRVLKYYRLEQWEEAMRNYFGKVIRKCKG